MFFKWEKKGKIESEKKNKTRPDISHCVLVWILLTRIYFSRLGCGD